MVADSCGVAKARVFHIYRGSTHKIALIKDFVKISVRKAYSSSKFKKGFKSKAIVIRTKFKSLKLDGSSIFFNKNSIVLLKKRLTPRGKELYGPINFGFKRRKFSGSFPGVV
jgi:ribosomal protein L14